MNEIKFKELDLVLERDNELFNEWIKEELEINPEYSFQNEDFNKIPGTKMTIVFDLDLEESKKCLHEWLLEEVSLNPDYRYNEDLSKKLPINENK